MGFVEAAKKDPNAQPAKKDRLRPLGGIGIDLGDQIFKAAMEQWHVQHFIGLGERIQRVQTLPECRQFQQDSMTHIRALEPFPLAI
jgi:hypothetical protein